MIHNIVTDKSGDEHQAVKGTSLSCKVCSLGDNDGCRASIEEIPNSECTMAFRDDGADVIYKRRIKIGDVIGIAYDKWVGGLEQND